MGTKKYLYGKRLKLRVVLKQTNIFFKLQKIYFSVNTSRTDNIYCIVYIFDLEAQNPIRKGHINIPCCKAGAATLTPAPTAFAI